MIERIAAYTCPECDRKLDAIGDCSNDPNAPGPEPGDPIACIGCGAVMTINGERRVVGLTDEQIAALIQDPEWMDEVAKLVARIHFLRTAN